MIHSLPTLGTAVPLLSGGGTEPSDRPRPLSNQSDMQRLTDFWHWFFSEKRVSICIGLLLIAIAFGVTGTATAQIATLQDHQSAKFDVRSEPSFRSYETVLRQLVQSHPLAAPNDFCILGQIADDNTKYAWVLWRQGRQVILWDGDGRDLKDARRKINLRTDVVATEGDLHGSTYLVTKRWVDALAWSCARDGVRVRIGKAGK